MIKKNVPCPYLNRCWLSEVGPPDGLEQRVVESEVTKACNGPRGNGARNMDSELVLQIYHLHQIENEMIRIHLALILVLQIDQNVSEDSEL